MTVRQQPLKPEGALRQLSSRPIRRFDNECAGLGPALTARRFTLAGFYLCDGSGCLGGSNIRIGNSTRDISGARQGSKILTSRAYVWRSERKVDCRDCSRYMPGMMPH